MPLIVTVATLLFTGLFQFISWWNSVSLQNTTDVASRATKTVEKLTAAFDERRYATFVFISSLRNLIDWKLYSEPPDYLSGGPSTTGMGNDSIVPKTAPNSIASINVDRQSLLDKLETDLRKNRFESYYTQLRRWNESFEQLLTEVMGGCDDGLCATDGLSSAADAPLQRSELAKSVISGLCG